MVLEGSHLGKVNLSTDTERYANLLIGGLKFLTEELREPKEIPVVVTVTAGALLQIGHCSEFLLDNGGKLCAGNARGDAGLRSEFFTPQ